MPVPRLFRFFIHSSSYDYLRPFLFNKTLLWWFLQTKEDSAQSLGGIQFLRIFCFNQTIPERICKNEEDEASHQTFTQNKHTSVSVSAQMTGTVKS